MDSSRVCLDASIAVAWLLVERYSNSADLLRQTWNEAGVEMVAPALFHAEVASAIRKQVYFKEILPDEGEEAFSRIYSATDAEEPKRKNGGHR